MNLPKKLVLNYKKWRCGLNGKAGCSHGQGRTELRNEEGYECCLGQFSKQCGIRAKELNGLLRPGDFGVYIEGLTSKKRLYGSFTNSRLSENALKINDDPKTTIPVKIKKLKELFLRYGYKIVVKNLPKKYK